MIVAGIGNGTGNFPRLRQVFRMSLTIGIVQEPADTLRESRLRTNIRISPLMPGVTVSHSRAFANEGYVIGLISSNKDNLQNLADEIKQSGGNVCYVAIPDMVLFTH